MRLSDRTELESGRNGDQVPLLQRLLKPEVRAGLTEKSKRPFAAAIDFAESADWPRPEELLTNAYAE